MSGNIPEWPPPPPPRPPAPAQYQAYPPPPPETPIHAPQPCTAGFILSIIGICLIPFGVLCCFPFSLVGVACCGGGAVMCWRHHRISNDGLTTTGLVIGLVGLALGLLALLIATAIILIAVLSETGGNSSPYF